MVLGRGPGTAIGVGVEGSNAAPGAAPGQANEAANRWTAADRAGAGPRCREVRTAVLDAQP
jgi:hypothetical protein